MARDVEFTALVEITPAAVRSVLDRRPCAVVYMADILAALRAEHTPHVQKRIGGILRGFGYERRLRRVRGHNVRQWVLRS